MIMRWIPGDIEESGDFKKSLKYLKLRKEEESPLIEGIHSWLRSKNDLLKCNTSNKLLFQKDKKYAFEVRIPSPVRNQGKSSGFRLIMLYDIEKKYRQNWKNIQTK